MAIKRVVVYYHIIQNMRQKLKQNIPRLLEDFVFKKNEIIGMKYKVPQNLLQQVNAKIWKLSKSQ